MLLWHSVEDARCDGDRSGYGGDGGGCDGDDDGDGVQVKKLRLGSKSLLSPPSRSPTLQRRSMLQLEHAIGTFRKQDHAYG